MPYRLRTRFLILLSCAFFACFFPGTSFSAETPGNEIVLNDISYVNSPDSVEVTFSFSGNPALITYELNDPYRVVVDTVSDSVFYKPSLEKDVSQGFLKKIRILPASLKKPSLLYQQGYSRLDLVMLEVDDSSAVKEDIQGSTVRFIISRAGVFEEKGVFKKEISGKETVKQELKKAEQQIRVPDMAKVAPAALSQEEPSEEELPKGKEPKPAQEALTVKPFGEKPVVEPLTYSPQDLEQLIEDASRRYAPLKAEQEEVNVARMKLKEARRALYPQASLKGTMTKGEVYNVDFKERSYGLQLEQPIYASGALRNTYKQAFVNLDLARKRYAKLKADYAYEVQEAYWSVVAAKINLKHQRQLLNDVLKLWEPAKKIYEEELSTKSEFLNIQTQVNQIHYQQLVAEKDLQMANLKLMHKLNLPSLEGVMTPDTIEPAWTQTLSLDELKQLAFKNRPEYQINKLLVESSQYEYKIAKEKNSLRVDVTGFYGRSGGAYITEPLRMQDDWFVWFKGTKSFGGNNASYSYTQNKTSPKLGQSTRTASASNSVEVGILDNYKGLTEVAQAKSSLEKAKADLQETKFTIEEEIEDSYTNWEKSLLQMKNAASKVDFRETTLQSLESQVALGEASLSQLLEAKIRLEDEFSVYNQALSSYKVSLAKLNKAIGIANYFK
jgi:outer membrane protein TolC